MEMSLVQFLEKIKQNLKKLEKISQFSKKK